MFFASQKEYRRRWLSVMLAVVLTFGYVGLFAGLFAVSADAAELTNVVIGVPETVYLTPQNSFSDTTTSVQYYVNNTVDSSGTMSLDAVNNATAGKFYVYSPQISSIDSISLNGASLSGLSTTKSGSLFSDDSFTMTLSSALASKGTALLEWTIKVTDTGGIKHALHAYTVAYNPYLSAVVSLGSSRNERGNNHQLEGFAWTSGIHGIESDGSWYSIAGCSPLGHTITSSGGDTSADDTWTYDNCIFSSVQFGQDKKNAYYWRQSYGHSSGDDSNELQEVTPWGLLTVDTSRNTNLNTIPNVTTGFHITDSGTYKGQPDVYAYICNLTENTATKKDSSGRITSGDHNEHSKYDMPWYHNEHDTYLWGPSERLGGDNVRTTASVAWNCSVTGTGVQYCYTKSAFVSYQADRCYVNLVGRVKVTKVNKSSLRNLIKDCYKYTSTYYPSTQYDTFITAWRNAATVLGDPTRSDTTDVYNALNSAKSALVKVGTLTLNTETTVNISSSGLERYYHFTPSAGGSYVFFSYGTSVDSQIYVNGLDLDVINGVGTQYAYDDDYGHNNAAPNSNTNTGGKGSDICVLLGNGTTSTTTQSYVVGGTESYTVVNLSANTTYFVKARCYSSYTGTYPMKVCKAVNITFDGTGGAKSNAGSVTYIMPAGHTMHMDQTGFSKSDHELIAWSTSGEGPEDKTCMATETITIPSADTTYYALWYPTDPTALTVNSTNTATISAPAEIQYYTFTPSETRTYLLYSTSTATALDPFVLIYDDGTYHAQGTYLIVNDDGGNSHHDFVGDANRNFYIEQELTEGTKYLIGVKAYHNTTANSNLTTGSYPFRFEAVYEVEYDANGGAGAPAEQEKCVDRDLTLSTAIPTREGYTFLGWSASSTATAATFTAGGTYTANADVKLYAVWQIHTSSLIVDPNGGTWNGSAASQPFTQNYGTTKTIADPVPPTAQKAFIEWKLNDNPNGSFTNGVYSFGPTNGATDTLTADFAQVVTDDTFILDCQASQLDVLSNDGEEGKIMLIPGDLIRVTKGSSGNYTLGINGGKVTFRQDTLLENTVTFTYTVRFNNAEYTASVTVVPASNIYLEEDGITCISGRTKENAPVNWTVPEDAVPLPSDGLSAYGVAVRPNAPTPQSGAYGFSYDEQNSSTYSMGTARKVTVDADTELETVKAAFSFRGTGFDLFSVTSDKTGVVLVTVVGSKTQIDPASGESVPVINKHIIVNTYMGYSYGKLYLTTDQEGNAVFTLTPTELPLYYLPNDATHGYYVNGSRRATTDPTEAALLDNGDPAEVYGWVAGEYPAGSAGAQTLYQVPIIGCADLPYDYYNVTVEPRYAEMMDVSHRGSFDFYLDSVRIYDPIDPDEISVDSADYSDVFNIYRQAKELSVKYQKLRDILIDAGDFNAGSAAGNSGVAFLEPSGFLGVSVQTYQEIGPKNEVYLQAGQAVAFNLSTSGNVQPEKMCVGVKMAKGGVGSLRVSCGGLATDLTVKGSTELYRDITAVAESQWRQNGSQYVTQYPIVIQNISDEGKIVSLTKLKWSYNERITAASGEAQQESSAPMHMLRFSFSRNALNTLNLTEYAEATNSGPALNADGVTVTWDKDSFELGETATLTVTAPDCFEKAYVDGHEIAGYEELEDGSRRWTYTVTAEELGLIPADVTLEDGNRYRTAALAAPELTATAPTVDLTETEIAWDAETITQGGSAILTVTVPAKVVAVTVDGETLTQFTLLEDGRKQFSYRATPENAGSHQFTVVLAEEHGYTFDAGLTPVLTVSPAPETPPENSTPTDPEEPENDDPSDPGLRFSFRTLLQAILNFFRKVMELFRIKAA